MLCQCDRYPEPHDHARPMYLHEDGTWHTSVKRVDGSEANVGDVVRCVSWSDEADRLADVLRWIVSRHPDAPEGEHPAVDACRGPLARYEQAKREANRAVSTPAEPAAEEDPGEVPSNTRVWL